MRLGAMIFAGVALAGLLAGCGDTGKTLTVATVNNADMIVMQKLSKEWEKTSGYSINWVVLEENALRQRVTTDVAANGGQFDIVTIGAYETPIWAKSGWLLPLDGLGADYDYADLLPPVRASLSLDDKLYAAPFYAESSFTMYRTDLFKAAGLTMPEQPTYAQIAAFADKLTDKAKGQYGICLRGKPGWGENMYFVTTLANTAGGRLFDMDWKPQFTSEPWKRAVNFYVDVMKRNGPPGAASNGFNENQALFSSGKCAIWVDTTSAAGRILDPKQSQVVDKTGFVRAPIDRTEKGSTTAWAWGLAVPASTKKGDAAKSFVKWATSKAYVARVGDNEGWVSAPPGTRQSTYNSEQYLKDAPFAPMVLAAILAADPANPASQPVPYRGVQFAAIPEFQAVGTKAGQEIAAALSGQSSVDAALQKAQDASEAIMKKSGRAK